MNQNALYIQKTSIHYNKHSNSCFYAEVEYRSFIYPPDYNDYGVNTFVKSF